MQSSPSHMPSPHTPPLQAIRWPLDIILRKPCFTLLLLLVFLLKCKHNMLFVFFPYTLSHTSCFHTLFQTPNTPLPLNLSTMPLENYFCISPLSSCFTEAWLTFKTSAFHPVLSNSLYWPTQCFRVGRRDQCLLPLFLSDYKYSILM